VAGRLAAVKALSSAAVARFGKLRGELLAIAALGPEEGVWFDSVIIEVARERVRSLYEQATELLAIRGLLNVPASESALKAVEDLFDSHQAVTFEEEDLRRRVEQLDKARIIAAAQFGGWSLDEIKQMLIGWGEEVHEAITYRLSEQMRAAIRLVEQLPQPPAKPTEYDL
jgi:hypothetical protein